MALDDALIAELKAADVLVLGVPMINFGVTSQLKNWLDAVARARVTFAYTEKGPVGLLTGKKVIAVVSSRGGIHRDQPTDTQVPYLRMMLGFLGMTDVEFVYAEGFAMGPDAEARALESARAEIARIVPGCRDDRGLILASGTPAGDCPPPQRNPSCSTTPTALAPPPLACARRARSSD